MKILFASAHLPSSTARQAGSRTSYGICEWLARNHDVHLLSFATALEAETFDDTQRSIFKSSRVFPVSNKDRVKGLLRSPSLPTLIAARSSEPFAVAFQEIQRSILFDVVILDHGQMLQYLPLCDPRSVTVGSLHDIYSQMWERRTSSEQNALRTLAYRVETKRVRHWERSAFQRTDLLVTLSGKDRDIVLRESQPKNPPTYIHPKIESLRTNLVTTGSRPQNRLLYWGAMNRMENVDAVTWAIQEILPRIRRKIPDARLYIAGHGSDTITPSLKNAAGVHVVGFVDDVSAMMASVTAALLPLRLGAGIKIKTLECMAAGLPVITTHVGAEGTGIQNEVHALIRETAEELAHACILILNSSARAAEISKAGQEKIQEFHEFDQKMQLAWDRVTELVENKDRIDFGAGRTRMQP
ncbi:glycosyltransferase [Terriglobus sp. TAA 43]|uniref:glycosyltransferase n=1 Tax=Terriglobus sp. TAA 43 TaxID=278961 RepID=UPI0006461909|nr:glycosyltransferase [Terriglobus sp. TAA 43]